MDGTDSELKKLFFPHKGESPPEVLTELQSIMRLHSLSPQDLFFKWESYSMKLGLENRRIDLKTARDFKKDINDALERETRGRMHPRPSEKRGVGATPRAAKATGDDVFGIIDSLSNATPTSSTRNAAATNGKRKNEFDTPAPKVNKPHIESTPGDISATAARDQGDRRSVPFANRTESGNIMQSLNLDLPIPEAPDAPPQNPRVKLKANTELSKFSYKTMAMKLSEASEILDDRIDEFLSIVQEHYELRDEDFGNPASQSTSEIIAVGRICSDTVEGKLTSATIVLETSRRTGAGLRVPLKLDEVSSYELFPGKIVALRGSNVSGEYFKVSKIMDIPLLGIAASDVSDVETIRERMTEDPESEGQSPRALNILVGSGPYTSDDNLEFEPLHALCARAGDTCADALILLGPFLDVEHPMVAAGDIPPLPPSLDITPDAATMTDVFRGLIALPLHRLAQSMPGLSILLVPSVRDAVQKHASWPQDRMTRKELGLPKQGIVLTNPVTVSLNEIMFGISSHDILYELKREECVGGRLPEGSQDTLARLSKHLIEQRHFFPLFPPTSRDNLPKPTLPKGLGGAQDSDRDNEDAHLRATGAMLDTSYLALAEWQISRPDILIVPSNMPQFVKVVENVLVINPGPVSKKKAAGSFAQLYVQPLKVTEEQKDEGTGLAHNVFERARVDITKI